jgi:hypothetical protein
MSTDFEAKLAALPSSRNLGNGRQRLFTDDELRALLAAQDRGVSAKTLFAAVGRSKNLTGFRLLLQIARKRLNGSAKATS